ncbi:tail fiber assembly protein [Pseudomonas sp.]|uniref:tail fiber assembly protein n=1 Tax=Pseudomonas sp. TaxID=306 RepID=UPI00338D9218
MTSKTTSTAAAPTIYCCHPTTLEYIGTAKADPDPLDVGRWLIPAYAYTDAPPSAGSGQVARRKNDDSGWEVAEDHRGTLYSTADGTATAWAVLGPIPEGFTDTPRTSQYDVWTDGAWRLDEGAELAAQREAAISRRNSLLQLAGAQVAPLQDAEELGIATEAESAALLAWKRYRVELSRIDQQAGFPKAIEWPDAPQADS